MTASTSDLLTQATTNSRPVPTTVTSTRAGGGTTLQCNALTGWATGSKVHFCTYKINTSGAKVAGSQLDMTGIVSGTQITNIVVKAGTDGGNAVGDIVEASPTAAYANDVYSWGTQDHDTQGRHKQLTDTNGNAIISLSATANAVNNLQVANAATGNGVIASAIGTDTNINIDLQPKGTGVVGVRQATTGLDAQLQARGGDTNINLVLSAKGTGNIKGVTEALKNPYKFSAYLNANQSIGTSLVKITLNATNFDTSSNFDKTTNYRFTAPIAGFYQFSWNVYINAGTSIVSELYKNGAQIARGSWSQFASSFIASSGSALIQLAASDYIELWAAGSASTTVVGSAVNDTYLTGFLVSAA